MRRRPVNRDLKPGVCRVLAGALLAACSTASPAAAQPARGDAAAAQTPQEAAASSPQAQTRRPPTPLGDRGDRPPSIVQPERLADFTDDLGALRVTVQGQLSYVALFADDQQDAKFRVGDNDAAPSLINTTLLAPLSGNPEDLDRDDAWKLGFVYEVNYPLNAADLMTQDDPLVSPRGVDHRKIGGSLHMGSYGRFAFGKDSTASDGTAALSFSGTHAAGSALMNQLGGGFLFAADRPGDDTLDPDGDGLTNISIASAFPSNQGTRLTSLRYDTPQVGGFRFAAAAADIQIYDASVHWVGVGPDGPNRLRGWRHADRIQNLEAVLAYRIDRGTDIDELVGSGSILLKSGWNLTLSGGLQNSRTSSTSGPDDGGHIYTKIGYRNRLISQGETALSADLYAGWNLLENVDRSYAVGLQVAQALDGTAVEIFAAGRHLWLEGVEVRDITLISTGFRVRF